MEGELRPRLCFLTKGDRGYGFHLHGERNKGGQFIRKVEPGSPADLGGLRPGDRVVEVNGENVEDEAHHQVSDGRRNAFSLGGGSIKTQTKACVVDAERSACKQRVVYLFHHFSLARGQGGGAAEMGQCEPCVMGT